MTWFCIWTSCTIGFRAILPSSPMLLTNLAGPEGYGAVLCWAYCWRSVLAAILKL